MEAYTDSVEAAQQRIQVAIEDWALWANGAGVIKDFYNAIGFAIKNIDDLIIAFSALEIALNLGGVINTFTNGLTVLASKVADIGMTFDRVKMNFATGKSTTVSAATSGFSNVREDFIFAQQQMFGQVLAKYTNTLNAQDAQAVQNMQKEMLRMSSTDKLTVAQSLLTNAQLTNISDESAIHLANALLLVLDENERSVILQKIASGEKLSETEHGLAALNNALKRVREKEYAQALGNTMNKSGKMGEPGSMIANGAGMILGGGIGAFGFGSVGESLLGDQGKIYGTMLGSMIGSYAGKSLVGAIAGVAGSTASWTTLLGPIGLALGLVGVAGWAIWKKHREKEVKEAQNAFKEVEEQYSAAKGSNVTAKQFDELANGVDSFGNNLTLTDDEYQEFLDKSNELAELFPELVVRTDEAGNKLVGIGNIVGGVTEKVADLNRELQHQSDVNLLNKYLSGEAFNDSYSQIKDLQNKINAINLGDTNALKEVYDKYNVKYKSEYDPHKDEGRIIPVEDEQQAANARANMIQEYENQINSLKKAMENYSQASVRELGYVDEAFQSQLDSMSDAEQTVYQELISNIDYRKTNSDGSYQYDLKGNYKMKSDEEINQEIRDITNQVDTAFEKLGEENIEIAFKKPSDYETLEEMQKSRNQLRNAIISAFGEDGYDDTEKQIIMKLGFEVNEDGVVTDPQNIVKKLRKEFNVKLFNGENISIENLKKLNFSDMQKAMEMLKEGTIDTTTSMKTLVNLLYADREPPKTLELARKYTEETFTLYDQLDNKAKNFFNTRGWENANIDEVFSKYPASIRGALKEAQESFKDGETDVSEFLDSISKMSASKIIDVMSNLAEVEIQSVFGEDFLGDIDGSINSLSELQKSLSAIADTYNKLGDAQKEQSLYGKLSLQTVTDLLASNINYAQVLEFETDEVTGNVTACKLKANAQKIMTEIQLRALKVNMQAAIAEEYQTIATNNAELAALGAADKQIDLGKNTAATIEVNNKAIKSFASVQGVISGVGAAIKALINGSSFAEIGAAYTNAYQTAMDKAAEGIQTAVWEKMYEKYTDEDKKERIDELVKLNNEAMARVNDYKLTISNIDTSIQTGNFTSLGADFGLDTTGKNLKDYDPMTKLETLKKLGSLIDKEYEAMVAKDRGTYTEYFKKIGDNLAEQKKAVLEEIVILSAELEKLTPGTEEYDKKYSELNERQADLIDIEKKIANLDDEEVEDKKKNLETMGATLALQIEAQRELIKTSDTEEELIERQKALNDLLKQEQETRKNIRDYQKELIDTELEYESASPDGKRYKELINQKQSLYAEDIIKAKLAIQDARNEAYQSFKKSQDMYDDFGNAKYTDDELWELANNSDAVQEQVKNYIEAFQSASELAMKVVEDNINALDKKLDRLENKRPNEWTSISDIDDYYNDRIDLLKDKIDIWEEALKDISNLTDEQITSLVDSLNEATKSIQEAKIARREDIKAQDDKYYEAITWQVNQYIDEIELAKKANDDWYDDEIKKLQNYNEDLDRTNELLELQNKLKAASQEKERVNGYALYKDSYISQ